MPKSLYSSETEEKLLRLIAENDEGSGVTFADHALARTQKFTGDFNERALQEFDLTSDRRSAFKIMAEAGLIVTTGWDAEQTVRLTRPGYSMIEAYDDQKFWRRFLKGFGSISAEFIRSFLFPVLVAVATVLLMNFLGLSASLTDVP